MAPLDIFFKLLTALLTPLSLSLLLMVLGLLLKQRALVLAAVLWLWLWSTPIATLRLADTLEHQHKIQPLETLPSVDAIVILGGALDVPVLPWFPEPNLGSAADRLVFGAKLWHAQKAPLLLFTGGSSPGMASEAAVAGELLRLMGVPASALVEEGSSRTTRENATLSAPLLRQRQVRRALLVTSAWHMPRSLMTFRAAAPDIEWVPAPCDPHAFRDVGFPGSGWLPNTDALNFSRMLFKEWLGLAWARFGSR